MGVIESRPSTAAEWDAQQNPDRGVWSLAALAFAIVGLAWLGAREPLAMRLRPSHFQDLGNLLLAFIMLWAYMMFSQYLIIWSGNLAEEIPWYIARTEGLWRWLPPLPKRR